MAEEVNRRRATDGGVLCHLALRAAQFWDFIDKRDIDKHAMAWSVFGVTCYLLYWVLSFVWANPDTSGADMGMIVAALMVPWTPVQAAAIKWYFDARST